MKVEERQVGGVSLLDVRGRLTMNDGHGQIRAAIDRLIARGSIRAVLNLRDLQYLDSACLGEIINAHIALSRKGGRLKMIDVPAHLHDLLKLAGLDGVFEAFTSEAEAVASFQAPDA
jgi:anti-sigma B factor antagonist